MNPIHFHLLVNHLPIVACIIATGVLFFGLILKNDSVQKTGIFITLFSSITAFIAHVSGEKAEHLAEEIEGISRKAIHHHEHEAEPFFQIMIIIGIISIITLFLWKRKPAIAKWLKISVLAGLLMGCFFAQKAGTSGGEIRHPEISNSMNSNTTSQEEEEQH